VARRILELAGRDEGLIEYVRDRPGHDRRYSLSSEKIRWELGWEPRVRFAEGLERTVEWCRDNEWWWGPDPLRRVPRMLRAPVRAGAIRVVARRCPG
jgi:dTDP-glucose 4,6-dehydratase